MVKYYWHHLILGGTVMRLNVDSFHKNTYGFQFKESEIDHIASIYTIGEEEQTAAKTYY